jgi:hypothetical protein
MRGILKNVKKTEKEHQQQQQQQHLQPANVTFCTSAFTNDAASSCAAVHASNGGNTRASANELTNKNQRFSGSVRLLLVRMTRHTFK